MDHTIKKVEKYIKEQNIYPVKIMVALSGGADSVCLLLMLAELGFECYAFHCNFHLRGEESNRDERFVRDLCARYNISLHVEHFDTDKYAHEHHKSIELAARELRYRAFQEFVKRNGCWGIAVGHHMDDNAETFMLNATRKAGVKGLCGMQCVTINEYGTHVMRPLLCLRRNKIEAYLKDRDESWITDSTNLEDDASRNKIRLSVIPTLERINPSAVDNLCDTMRNLNEVAKVFEAEMERCASACTKVEDDVITIYRKTLEECVSPISVLHYILSPLGFNETQIRNLLTAKGYRANRPKGGREMQVRGGKTMMIDVTWKTIQVRGTVK